MAFPRVAAVHTLRAIEGGRITIDGTGFPVDQPQLPEVTIGDVRARVVFASPTRLVAIVPSGLDGGRVAIRIGGVSGETMFVDIAGPLATGLHQVDNPVFDREGNLYVAASLNGRRGIARVTPEGQAELVLSGMGLVGLALLPTRRAVLATTSALFSVDWNFEGLALPV